MVSSVVVPRRELGPGGPSVPVFALGSWNIWDRMDAEERVALVRRAVEVGAPFFDVAYYNMGPHAEASRTDLLFAEAVREVGLSRDAYQLCGKLWLWEYPRTGFAEQMDTWTQRVDSDFAEAVVVGDFMSDIDIRQVVDDVNAEVARGRIGVWGVNNWTATAITTALDHASREGLVPPTFAQLKYSVARRAMAEGPHYGELFASGRLALQASDVFEGGILVGKTAPERKIGADVGGIREQIVATYPSVLAVAEEWGATPAQVGIAFTLANPATANVLFGASRVSQLDDAVGALVLLSRVGSDGVREALASLQCDTGVNPDGTW